MAKIFAKSKIGLLLIVVFTLILYSYRLDFVPVHLNQDELEFSLNAYSISQTLKDTSGHLLPFYFWHLDAYWATPVIVYLTSILLKFLPLSETVIRLPSVFVGVFSISTLVFLIDRIFKDKRITFISGILAVSTPALFINSRLLLDNIYTIPFICLWLVFMYRYMNTKRVSYLFLSGLILGIGIHSYHAAKIMMPVYMTATLLHGYMAKWLDVKRTLLVVLGFLVPILAFLPWLFSYPDTLSNQISYVSGLDKTISVQKGVFGVFNLERATTFVSNYFTYFSPKILFTEGDMSMIHSTGMVGAFLFPTLFLLIFGAVEILRKRDVFGGLILFGFLTYPIAPAIINEPQRISRGLVVIPFVILLCAYGVRCLFEQKEKIFRYLLIAIFALSVLEFILFLGDYFGDYRKRSYVWFNNNIPAAMQAVIDTVHVRNVTRIYLDEFIPFVNRYFAFYQIKNGADLSTKWELFDYRESDFWNLPKGSLVVHRGDHVPGRGDGYGNFEKIEIVREPDGSESFYLYFRDW